MKHEIFLDFVIADFEDISHEEISQILSIIPSKIYVKGQKKIPNSISDNPVLIKRNRWLMKSQLDEYHSFEDQMNNILDILEPKIDTLKPLVEKYSCYFSCGLFLRFDNGESIPSIYLNSRYNKLIKELDIKFDIDIYCLPNDGNKE